MFSLTFIYNPNTSLLKYISTKGPGNLELTLCGVQRLRAYGVGRRGFIPLEPETLNH